MYAPTTIVFRHETRIPAMASIRQPTDLLPIRRTLAQLHRDLGRSRYTGADLRRLAADPHRRECLRRRARATRWRAAVGPVPLRFVDLGIPP